MNHNSEQTGDAEKLAAKNKRLGIILALVAAGFYAGFILKMMFFN